jgi:predicted transcriptional regulator
MKIYLKEKIGNPDLFTGRKKELSFLLNWSENIKKELSRSMAILSRRKTGKSALFQRLFNIIFHRNDGLIPFYYEIKEYPQWIIYFAQNFFLSFISQYIAFKTRNIEYLREQIKNFDLARTIVQKYNMNYLLNSIDSIEKYVIQEDWDSAWNIAREAPREIASLRDERVIQIIDEFQYMGKMIHYDKEITRPFKGMAGTYFHTAEYKNAPLLISGSWIGWLLQDLGKHLHGRFKKQRLDNMSETEAVEMIFNYSFYLDIPINKDVAELILNITRGNPFYIAAIFYSDTPDKDFTTEEGLRKTLEFEITDDLGDIRGTWMEYIDYAFAEINGQNPKIAKNIVLYLCQNRNRQVSRKELAEKLQIKISDAELEKRLKSLLYNDIIERGRSNFYYQGVKDHIFDKVFRTEYADEITEFDPQEITNEYKKLFEEAKAKYASLQGEYNSLKGRFGEYRVIDSLRFRAYNKNDLYCAMMKNIPDDFEFTEYKTVWKYSASVIFKRDIEIDIFARAVSDKYSLIGEVKNRKGSFDLKEAKKFLNKANQLIELESVPKAALFVLCVGGFTKEAIEFFKDNKIVWSEDERWLD